jgi:ribosomal protein S18 acetylase RimI-like enzyme
MSQVTLYPEHSGHLRLRRPTLADSAAVTGLINVCAVVETGVFFMTVEQLESIWQSASLDLQTDAWLLVEPGGRVVGYAEVWLQAGTDAPYCWLSVHPEYAGLGLEARLLQLAETRVRQTVNDTGRGSPSVVRAATVSFNQSARRMLYRQGFRLKGRFWRMDNSRDSAAGWLQTPDYVACRAYLPADDDHGACRYDIYEKELAGQPGWAYVG